MHLGKLAVSLWQVNSAVGEAVESVKEAGAAAAGAVSDAAATTAVKVKEASKDSSLARGALVVGETVGASLCWHMLSCLMSDLECDLPCPHLGGCVSSGTWRIQAKSLCQASGSPRAKCCCTVVTSQGFPHISPPDGSGVSQMCAQAGTVGTL